MRWLFYAINGWGIGHIVRSMALARQIRKRAPNDEFLFLTNCEATNLLWQEGFASVKFPSLQAGERGMIQHRSQRFLQQAFVTNTFAAFRPDVTVVDTFPTGWANELLPLLRYQPRRVFITREKGESVRRRADFQQHLRLFHRIVVMHEPGEVELPIPEEVPAEFAGYFMIRSRDEVLAREEARRRLRLPQDAFIVYVGFGGGGDDEYRRLSEWVLSVAAEREDWLLAVGRPPLLRLEERPAPPANVVEFSYFPLAECWSAFDGAVSALGTNTIAELLHQGVPAIFLPRDLPEDDHAARAGRIRAKGAGWIVEPFDSEGLKRALAGLSDPGGRARVAEAARAMVPANGAERAAEYLLGWLRQPARPRAAAEG